MLHLHQSHYRTSYNCEHENVYIFILALCAKATLIHTYTRMCFFFLTKYSLCEVTACAWLHSAVCTKNTLSVQDLPAIIYIMLQLLQVFTELKSSIHHILGWRQLQSGKLKSVCHIYAKSYTLTIQQLIDTAKTVFFLVYKILKQTKKEKNELV